VSREVAVLTTAAILVLEWRRRSTWGGAAAARRGQRGGVPVHNRVGLVAPEDVRPSDAEMLILPRTPDEALVVDVARGLDSGTKKKSAPFLPWDSIVNGLPGHFLGKRNAYINIASLPCRPARPPQQRQALAPLLAPSTPRPRLEKEEPEAPVPGALALSTRGSGCLCLCLCLMVCGPAEWAQPVGARG